ncbi:MAG: long-chain fatty acid--CoA ligase [Acidobacteria bacterium]|nr:long-chain fatty acid--CoA ligase [Acidobacteriota bacterium]
MLYSQTLGRAARYYPEVTAVVDGERRVTYAQLDRRAAQLAAALAARGFAAGDRLGVLLPNCLEFLETIFACCRMGVIAVPINTRYAVAEIDEVLRDSTPRGLIRHNTLPRPTVDTGWEVVIGEQCLEGREADPPPVFYDSDALFGLFYTSGTTGRAKGVMLSHGNLLANLHHMQSWTGFRYPDVWLHAAPMFHLADFPAMLASAAQGVTQVTLAKFDLHLVCEVIQRERVTRTVFIPTMINLLTLFPDLGKYDLSSLQMVVYGGSPMAPEIINRTREKLPGVKLGQGYGLTETSPLLTTLYDEEHTSRRLLSCGRPVMGVEVAVVDPMGNPAPVGTPGEIVARGPNVMKGYWKNEQATRDAFLGDWFRTGDIAYQDEEGYLYIVDRQKDMIVTGGENVYSSEVEAAIYSHSAIKECAVIGVPDPNWGEAVMACVTLQDGAALTAEELVAHCRTRLANYKLPRRVEFLPGELPKSGTNKILKRALRDPYWQGYSRRVG